jgi:hypothetical protein
MGQLKVLIKEIVRLLCENVTPKFWWLSPDAELYPVQPFGHHDWAVEYLTKNMIPIDSDPYTVMISRGWSRVSFYEYMGKKEVEYYHSSKKPLSRRQMKELKDLAIEKDARLVPFPFDV